MGGRTITVNQAGVAGLTVAPSSLAFGTLTVGSTSSALTLTVRNPETSVAQTISAIALGGTAAADFRVTGSAPCQVGGVLAALQSCTLNVTFVPSVVGSRAATLSVTTAAGTTTATVQGDGQAAACVYTVTTPVSASAPATTLSASVTTGTGCAWTATTATSWITLQAPVSGSGNGSFNYLVAANTGTVRTGSITVGGRTITVNQAGVSALTVTPSSLAFGTVTLGSTSSALTLTVRNPDLSLAQTISAIAFGGTAAADFRATGLAPCQVGGVLAASQSCTLNVSFVPSVVGSRAATLSVTTAAGTTSTALQGSGLAPVVCATTLTPSTATISGAGGSGSIAVADTCGWTATPSASWITITSGSAGSGSGTVGYAVAANTGVARSGTIAIGTRTFTITQEAACTFTVTTPVSVAAAASTYAASVTTGTGCTWTASTSTAWITLQAPVSGSGSGSFSYLVGANSGTARAGSITVGGRTIAVDQASVSGLVMAPTSLAFGSVTVGAISSALTITVRNPDASMAQTISAIALTGAAAADFHSTGSTACQVGGVLAATQSCTLERELHPVGRGDADGSAVGDQCRRHGHRIIAGHRRNGDRDPRPGGPLLPFHPGTRRGCFGQGLLGERGGADAGARRRRQGGLSRDGRLLLR